jgi:hypothetical protein
MAISITTSDGFTLTTGDRAFNYYDHEAGTIGEIDQRPDGGSHWFDFKQDNGCGKSLNGERICSVEYAERRGWLTVAGEQSVRDEESTPELVDPFEGAAELVDPLLILLGNDRSAEPEYCCPKHGVHEWEPCGLCLAETNAERAAEALENAAAELGAAAEKRVKAAAWLARVTATYPLGPISQRIAAQDLDYAESCLNNAIHEYELARKAAGR